MSNKKQRLNVAEKKAVKEARKRRKNARGKAWQSV